MANPLDIPPCDAVAGQYLDEVAPLDSPRWWRRQRRKRSFYRVYWRILV